MERTKGNETPLEEQGQEPSRGERREQRCRPELSADGGGLHLWRECRGRQALCRVSRGQRPFGRVQGDNACSGVQRVKPLAQ